MNPNPGKYLGRYTLAIETAVGAGSLSLLEAGREAAGRTGGSAARSIDLLAEIEETLELAGIEKNELAAIAVSDGPGSLTGIRIGLAIAKGISDACGIPYRVVSVPEALTGLAGDRRRVTTAVSIGRGQIALDEFVRNEAGVLESAAAEREIRPLKDFAAKIAETTKREESVLITTAETVRLLSENDPLFVPERSGMIVAGPDLARLIGLYGETPGSGSAEIPLKHSNL